jgi:site-specific DNA-cytosine methylase
MNVECQLETHGFGQRTCEEVFDTPFLNEKNADWPNVEAEMAFGNPRCTAFSTITGGYEDDCHGPWAKQTQDIHQLCEYAAGRYDIVVWESVQQAFSTGRPLLNYLRDKIFTPKHYRIAHVLLNAASFGNSQRRKRYFFVAYRDDRNFNVVPPTVSSRPSLTYDDLWKLRDRVTHAQQLWQESDYDFDSCTDLSRDEWTVVPLLPNGWDLNLYALWASETLPSRMKETWETRTSDMPFSMHGLYRLNWLRPFPTIHSSAGRWIHPDHDRPLTIGELATAMGWEGRIPRGPMPIAQIAKGVVPDAGEWIAQQAINYLDDHWGDEDWESRYCDRCGQWLGKSTSGEREKTFNLTRYVGHTFDRKDYDVPETQSHRFPLVERRERARKRA